MSLNHIMIKWRSKSDRGFVLFCMYIFNLSAIHLTIQNKSVQLLDFCIDIGRKSWCSHGFVVLVILGSYMKVNLVCILWGTNYILIKIAIWVSYQNFFFISLPYKLLSFWDFWVSSPKHLKTLEKVAAGLQNLNLKKYFKKLSSYNKALTKTST